jgi:hypothetical protein
MVTAMEYGGRIISENWKAVLPLAEAEPFEHDRSANRGRLT